MPAHAQDDQRGIEAYDRSVIPVNPFHQAIADVLQGHNLIQIICR